MTEQLSPSPAKTSVIDELFEMVTTRNLDIMLRRAVELVVHLLEAKAGSILFQSLAIHNIRFGEFEPASLSRIKHWEEVISRRMQESAWNIPADTSLPISISKPAEPDRPTLLNIPLLQDTTVTGSLSVVLPPGSQLADAQRSLFTRVARSIGQMLALVADLEVAHKRLRQMSVLYKVEQTLVTNFELSKFLAEIMQLTTDVIDAGAASLMLVDEKQGDLIFEVSHGIHGKVLRQQRIPLNEGIAGWVAHNGRAVIANDARTDPRFSHRVDVRTGFLTQSIAAVPLQVKGQTIGVLEVLNKYSGPGFDQEDLRMMSAIATQAAIAIQNARLYQQLRQERDVIIKTEETVRHEVATHLHDGPIQLLSAISMRLDYLQNLAESNPAALAPELKEIRTMTRRANQGVRNALFELRPIILETQGLVAAVAQYVVRLRQSEKFRLEFQTAPDIKVPPESGGVIFSIIQEAINNIRRHAEAKTVWVSLELESKGHHLIVTVRDDGVGFDVAKFEQEYDQHNFFGIFNMRERARLLEAQLLIESRPHQGTTVRCLVPLPPKEG
jgi:signal transduction histidine kinase